MGDGLARVAYLYDPGTAQFLTRDPLADKTRQPYGYVNGNPLNRADPTGLDTHVRWEDMPDGSIDYIAEDPEIGAFEMMIDRWGKRSLGF